MKGTAPGVSWKYSYDKVGRVTDVVNHQGRGLNIYTVKTIFETHSAEMNELWLQKHDSEEMMNISCNILAPPLREYLIILSHQSFSSRILVTFTPDGP